MWACSTTQRRRVLAITEVGHGSRTDRPRGIVEIGLGAALLLWRQPLRAWVGALTALFFIAIFPGNIAQFVEQRDAFGLDTDTKRAVRLLFQPALIAWAIAATDARDTLLGDADEPATTADPA